jgi:thioredoxin-related protein
MSASQVMIMNYLLLNNINNEIVFVEKTKHKHKRFKNIHEHINTHVSFKNVNQKMRKFHNIKQPGHDVQRFGHK